MLAVMPVKSGLRSYGGLRSMDFGGVTAEYVHQMWGGTVAIEEIRPALRACLKEFYGR